MRLCHWRIAQDDLVVATSSASSRRIELAWKQLEGQMLVSVNIQPETGATNFVFDLGGVLHCRRYEKNSADTLWTLYKPGGYVLMVNGNGTYCHQRGTQQEKHFCQSKMESEQIVDDNSCGPQTG